MPQDKDSNYFDVPESGTPGNPRIYEGVEVDCDPRHAGIDPATKDDLLKCSAKHDVLVRNFVAVSDGTHKEDGIDLMNESERVVFENGRVQAGRKGVAITNKGGNRDCTFRRVVIEAPYGKFTDIEDGNWADQSWRKTTGTTYDEIARSDGKPVRYAWGRAARARLLHGQYEIVWGWTILLHLYVYAKRAIPFIP